MSQVSQQPYSVICGDMRDELRVMIERGEQFHSIVTDPPYHLTSITERWGKGGPEPEFGADGYFQRATRGFMGATWDGGDIAMRRETWRLCWELLPPGGHLIAFGGSRTFHRMAVAIEDAGFEIRDTLFWLYGQGKPASHDASKLIDKALGAEREALADGKPVKRMIPGHDQNTTGSWIKDNGRTFTPQVTAPGSAEAAEWDGWGTNLKPAFEPIILARKPIASTIAANLLRYRVGALNIDACRVPTEEKLEAGSGGMRSHIRDGGDYPGAEANGFDQHPGGRWPANILHDGSEMVLRAFAWFGTNKGAKAPVTTRKADKRRGVFNAFKGTEDGFVPHDAPDQSAARFFYQAAFGPADRWGPAPERFMYCPKATSAERVVQCRACGWRFIGEPLCACAGKVRTHPTVKPISLMEWAVKLVTPPGGRVLDPFAGSGTTLRAAVNCGFSAVGVEMDAEHAGDIHRRFADGDMALQVGEAEMRAARAKAAAPPAATLPLFAAMDADDD